MNIKLIKNGDVKMQSMVKSEICKNVNFTYIPDKKFKTAIISFSMFTPLDKKCASKNAIIPSLLAHSCKEYPSLLEISTKLEELYGATISPSITKLGDIQILTLAMQSISNNFISDSQNNVLEATNLLCEMIFNPNTENESFKEENIAQEKRQLIEDIKSEMNDKKIYARRKCEEIMCKNEKFGINVAGTIENVEKLDGSSVYKAWQKLLKHSHIEIKLIGSCAYEPIINEFKNRFLKIIRNEIVNCSNEVIKKASHITEITEKMDIVQCKLVIGMRTEIAKPDEDVQALKVMNALFGGTAQSKLFVNVREKLSLCYYCSSKYNSQKGIIFIESGVEKKNIEKAKDEILKQLEDIKLGNFSDEELEQTKLYLCQSTEKVKDSLSSLNAWYSAQTFDENQKSPDEIIEKIKEVSREKVINVAQKITLDTVYMLTDKE